MSIYLIGGPPKCGKTTLARILSKRLLIPWISTDTLQGIARAYIPKEQHAALFPHSHFRSGTDNDDFYSRYSAEEIVQRYVEQSKATYDAISVIVETYITDEDDFIVEGYHVTPEIVNRILKKFNNEHIKSAFLLKKNEQQLLKDFHESTTPNDWVLRKTNDEATFTKIAHMVTVYSEHVEKEANMYDLPTFSMDTDFSSSLEGVVDFLLGS